ncbi:hypothetical protein O9569_01195 [Proteus mirabilis]|uniref:hypothetical protein n=1 Tax=Proteus mirabilis TaxID=584 RepID=UPI0025768F0A|nr:hypothetical protein [Proteus mirabilis]MDM3818083.1 hypothetical protein [Proteus mirabilis]HCT1419413.1 hypothetical protein [Proteus mirabilis]
MKEIITDILKEEINGIMDRAAMGNATVCILNRFANTVQIAAFLISKGKVKEATDWLYGALEWDSEVDIFGDLKDSDGNSEDIQTWFDKQMEGEISFAEAIELIRKHYTELEKLRTA